MAKSRVEGLKVAFLELIMTLNRWEGSIHGRWTIGVRFPIRTTVFFIHIRTSGC